MHNEVHDAIRAVAAPSLESMTHWRTIPERRIVFSKAHDGPSVLDVHMIVTEERIIVAVAKPGVAIEDVPPRDPKTGGRLRFDVRHGGIAELAEALDAVRAASHAAAGTRSPSPDVDRFDSMLRAGVAVGRYRTVGKIAEVFDSQLLREELVEALQVEEPAPGHG